MPLNTSALSAICGIHLGETKLVTSIVLSPVSDNKLINFILISVGTMFGSFCKPSLGLTSTNLTLVGKVIFLIQCYKIQIPFCFKYNRYLSNTRDIFKHQQFFAFAH